MKIGDKVVCVDISPCSTCGESLGLVQNNVYVINGFTTNYRGVLQYHLLGFVVSCKHNHPRSNKLDVARACRFRKHDDLKQEASENQQVGIKIHRELVKHFAQK